MKRNKKYNQFPKLGYCDFGQIINSKECKKLKNRIV